MDEIDDKWWNTEFRPGSRQDGVDHVSRDGRIAVEVRKGLRSLRDFDAEILQLARAMDKNSSIQQACLVLVSPTLSLERIRHEWATLRRVVSQEFRKRLSIVALTREGPWVEPDEPFFRRIANVFEGVTQGRAQDRVVRMKSPESRKFYEAVKILLVRWLRHEEPIAIGSLAEGVGCSYPTIRSSLRRLEQDRYIQRHSNRTVELTRFPTKAWEELLALDRQLRQPIRFIDASGDKPNPIGLIERLQRMRPSGIALGGVLAARHWHQTFDLHGTPRVDLVAHAPDAVVDLKFVKRLDPALKIVDDTTTSATLVIRPLVRNANLFESMGSEMPVADPVETTLDLSELGLTQQASKLLAHFRKEVRLS
jgi:predicted transcriptional regulator